MTKKKAIISWVPSKKGGRTRPPEGGPYRAVARFADDSTWPAQAWSLAVLPIKRVGPTIWVASVMWIVESAPQHVLKAGGRFELYEGRKLVALGLIIASNRPAPSLSKVRSLVMN